MEDMKNTKPIYTMSIRFATETIALLCEKSQNLVSARRFPTRRSDMRTKAKVFLQGCPFAPANRVHDLEAVARRQSRRDSHGGNFAPKGDFLPLEWQCGLRDNRSIKPDLPGTDQITLSKGLRHTVLSGFRLNG